MNEKNTPYFLNHYGLEITKKENIIFINDKVSFKESKLIRLFNSSEYEFPILVIDFEAISHYELCKKQKIWDGFPVMMGYAVIKSKEELLNPNWIKKVDTFIVDKINHFGQMAKKIEELAIDKKVKTVLAAGKELEQKNLNYMMGYYDDKFKMQQIIKVVDIFDFITNSIKDKALNSLTSTRKFFELISINKTADVDKKMSQRASFILYDFINKQKKNKKFELLNEHCKKDVYQIILFLALMYEIHISMKTSIDVL